MAKSNDPFAGLEFENDTTTQVADDPFAGLDFGESKQKAASASSIPEVTINNQDQVKPVTALDKRLPFLRAQAKKSFESNPELFSNPSARKAYYDRLTAPYSGEEYYKVQAALSEVDPYLKKEMQDQLVSAFNPLPEFMQANAPIVKQQIQSGIEQLGRSQAIGLVEGKGSEILNNIVGGAKIAIGAAGAVIPELAAFNIAAENVSQKSPDAAEWMMPISKIIHDKYEAEGKTPPAWISNTAEVADFVAQAGVGALLVGGKPNPKIKEKVSSMKIEDIESKRSMENDLEKLTKKQQALKDDISKVTNESVKNMLQQRHDELTPQIEEVMQKQAERHGKEAENNAAYVALDEQRKAIESQMENLSNEGKAALKPELEKLNESLKSYHEDVPNTPQMPEGGVEAPEQLNPTTDAIPERIPEEVPVGEPSGNRPPVEQGVPAPEETPVAQTPTPNEPVKPEAKKQIDYSQGKRADENAPPGMHEDEFNRHVAETSENPLELAQAYVNLKHERKTDYIGQIINDYGLAMTEEDFGHYQDPNAVSPILGKQYFRADAKPLDVSAQEMSETAGIEITPQMIVDHLSNEEVQRYTPKDIPLRSKLKQRFAELTGGEDLTPKKAKAIIDAESKKRNFKINEDFIEPETNDAAELYDQYRKAIDEGKISFSDAAPTDIAKSDRRSQRVDASRQRLDAARKALSDKLRGGLQSGGLNAIPEFIDYVKALIAHGVVKAEDFIAKFREDFSDLKYTDEELKTAFADHNIEIPEGEVKKTVATVRAYEGDIREGVKKEIEKLGLTREVQNLQEAKESAKKFIETVGEDRALEAVRNNDVSDAQGAYVWNEIIESVNNKLAKETDPAKIAELEKREGELFQEFSRKALSGGRFSAALGDIYSNSDLGYNLTKKIEDFKAQNQGVIPPEVEQRFRELDAELKEVKRKLAEAEEAKKSEPKIFRDKKIKEGAAKIADAIRKGKLSRPDVFSAATPASLVWDGALEVVAKTVEATGSVAQAVADGLAHIRESDWYKNLDPKKQDEASDAFEDWFSEKRARQERKIKNLQKQLEDLKSGKTPSAKEKVPETKHEKELREQIQKEKENLGLIPSKPVKTARTKADIAQERLQKQIDEYERRITEKDFSKPEKGTVIDDPVVSKLKAEKLRLQGEYDKEFYKNKLENRTRAEKVKDALWSAWGLGRALMATGEASFVGVQGLTETMRNVVRNPKAVADAFKNSWEFFKSPARTEQWLNEVKSQSWYPELKESGLSLTEPHAEITAREELFVNDWANGIWNIVGQPLKLKGPEAYARWKQFAPFKAFERGAVGYLDALRVHRWLEGREMLQRQGINFKDNPQAYKDMADVVNTLTGRASLGAADSPKMAETLSKLFFSPRNWASAIKTSTPYGLWHFGKMRAGSEKFKPTVAQKIALEDLSIQIGLTTGLVIAAQQYLEHDGDPNTGVERDPTSSDFGKIKLGDRRVDPWGGKIQQVVLLSRLISDSIKKQGGQSVPLGIPYQSPTGAELLVEMATNKLSPAASIIEKRLSSHKDKDGEGRVDKYGNEYAMSSDLLESSYPIYYGTIADLAKDGYDPTDAFLTFYSFFGGGVQQYNQDDRMKKELQDRSLNIPVDKKKKELEKMRKKQHEEELYEFAKKNHLKYMPPKK